MSDQIPVSAEVNGSEPFAEARGSGAPDPTQKECEACEGTGRHLVGHTGFGAAMYQSCCLCDGTGRVPVIPNEKLCRPADSEAGAQGKESNVH